MIASKCFQKTFCMVLTNAENAKSLQMFRIFIEIP